VPLLRSLADIAGLKETWQIECKLARGRDGEGALPEDIWETYGAFANTQGGDIFLGLRELGPGNYELAGISNPGKVIGELMTGANDPKRVSVNLLCIESVAVIVIEGFNIIHINIPKAPIYLRPVYIGNDPLNGSFVRDRSSDIKLSPDRVRRMQARVRGELLGKA
jgi:predicted HTH transcriptional regulator